MPNNYILLETIALTQSAASVTFDNLPTSGYTDLKVVSSARSDRADTSDNIIISFNGSTANLSFRYLQGNGASAYSSSGSTGYVGSQDASTATANTFGNAEYYIPNYRSANFKSVSSDAVDETNATNAYATLTAQLWSNTAAITSINLKPQVGSNFVANSTFSLYGVAALGTTPVLAPKAFGGNSIENDGTYWIHTFTSSGNFVPQVGLTCDVLVVAGGGGVYWDAVNLTPTWNGGGGAGGFRTATNFSVGNALPVTVGAGGARGTSPSKGANSVFSSITATGGGGSAFENAAAGSAGGSGGGGGGASSGTGGTGNQGGFSPAEGNNGGNGGATFGGSGGGSSAAGATGSSNGVAGGAGTSNSYSGSAVTYAAGGAGGNSVTGNGTANRGNGANATGNGGSGIVIIRYPIA